MDIVIVGGLGTETRQLENSLATAITELGIKASIGVAAGVREMAAYDVHYMPALIINGKLIFEGVVPSIEKIKEILLAENSRQSIGSEKG